jgi:putative serine/threonine protein kinase
MTKARINELLEQPYVTILGYPKATRTELKRRIFELKKLGIDELEFTGEKRVLNMCLLGKGCVGLVTIAHGKTGQVALKIRRTDSDRKSMLREAKLLQHANAERVGPRFISATRNFLVMEFVKGELLPRWLEKGVTKTRLVRVLRKLLEQCWRLDNLHLDHGELSYAPKHVIINDKDEPFIVDFETASIERRPSNVTAMVQFLFLSGFSPPVVRKIGLKSRKRLLDSLRRYKHDTSHENLMRVLESCGL